ncbi:MAG: HAMP domain-containing histidine kinase [Flavobacteriaceae bacterium]|jgi:two-component system OmpR family sensor kinase/two-component system phosphate regulon sensor histidine kinase PhoR|nr:HAMP domain-containing histidine kinase [Flavobacteriaceae bacterium]
MKHLSYKHKIFAYFFTIFAIFTAGLVIFEQKREETEKQKSLENILDNEAEQIHSYIKSNQLVTENISRISEIVPLFPKELRITIINRQGKVIFDNDIDNLNIAENHLNRPEIQESLTQPFGSYIHLSATLGTPFFYYAKLFDNQYFIRTSLPYNTKTKNSLKADKVFIYFSLGAFLVGLLLLNYVSNRFAKSISQLREFALLAEQGESLPEKIEFQDDELGEIGQKIHQIFEKLQKNQQLLSLQAEKLRRHLQYLEEGLCLFTEKREKVYANTHFIQYLNFIIDGANLDIHTVFNNDSFREVQNFLNSFGKSKKFNTQISKNGKIFQIQVLIFEDNSFEISIRDVSALEKRRLMKQEMTNSIAHELRTPVTSLRAFLETLNEQNLPESTQKQFINRSYMQAVRLSELIEDITLITKLEEASSRFSLDEINIFSLLEELKTDLKNLLKKNRNDLHLEIDANLTVKGNYTLLYSIFRNLLENTMAYAGEGAEIHVRNYFEDSNYHYFSYFDTGKGVDEKYLSRLFERFYRINEGRGRDSGGSGLGLSIVKNAVLFHQGEIQVKNRAGGGLEFLFTLKKQKIRH